MAADSSDPQISALIESMDKLVIAGQQVATSLAKLETLYIEMLRKQDEDRAEAKERQKEFDERQKRWDEREKEWEVQDWWRKNPWLQPDQLGYLLLMVALAALAITVSIIAAR